jgi:hypothetical protein
LDDGFYRAISFDALVLCNLRYLPDSIVYNEEYPASVFHFAVSKSCTQSSRNHPEAKAGTPQGNKG